MYYDRRLKITKWRVNVKSEGEVYDVYDFNVGKIDFAMKFNSDGGWVQYGYSKQFRDTGKIFITSIPFEDVEVDM